MDMDFEKFFKLKEMDKQELIALSTQLGEALREFVETVRDETCPECKDKIGKFVASKVMGIFEDSAKKAKQAKNN